jgi:tetratricopeptide (TPR) repeat protein
MKHSITIRTCLLLLVFAVLGVYYPAIFSPLNSVDDPGMYSYLLNSDGFSLRALFFHGGSGEYYRPLLVISYMMDKYVWGLQESFMHLENVVFHLCNTLLLFAVARRACLLRGIKGPLTPLTAAVFFALHPINTEAVNWIAGRTDLLACFFVLLSVWLMLRLPGTWIGTCLAALSLLMACLSKETAIFFLPAALILPFFMPQAETGKSPALLYTLRRNVPHFILFTSAGFSYFVFRALAFTRGDSGVSRVLTHVVGDQSSGFLDTLRPVLKAAGFYVKKLFLPFPLNFAIIHVSDLYLYLGVVLFFVVLWLLTRRTLSGFFFIAAVSVGSSALIIPLLRLTWTPLAERYLYIPSAFFVVGMVIVLHGKYESEQRGKILTAGACFLLLIAVYGTVCRTLLWQDNLALFQDTLKKSPRFMPAKNEIANALYAQGREQEADSVIKSIEMPENMANFQLGLMSKAALLARQGNIKGAQDVLNEALKTPGKYEARIIAQIVKINENEVLTGRSPKNRFYTDNVQLLSRLYQITGNPFVLYRLGQTHLFAGDRAKAREYFAQVVAKAPEKVYYRQAAKKLLVKLTE